MAEFLSAGRARESRFRKRVEDAVLGRLNDLQRLEVCAFCNTTFRGIESMGRRECTLHPSNPGKSASFGGSVGHHRHHHHACCGKAERSAQCALEAFPDVAFRGCTRCDHGTDERYRAPPYLSVGTIRLSFHGASNLLRRLHIEPRFLLERVAALRYPEQSTTPDPSAVLGTATFHLIDHPERISARACEYVTVRAGGVDLSLNLREAYVDMLQRYCLPHRVLETASSAPIATIPEEGAQGTRDSALHALVNRALQLSASATAPRRESRTLTALEAAGEQVDVYYDAGSLLLASTSSMETADDATVRGASSATDLARRISAHASASREQSHFYPFYIWSWMAEGVDDSQNAMAVDGLWDARRHGVPGLAHMGVQ